ncbi:sulfotransferase domain-containing protein [Solimicrobium silvestre]|uniref:Sulfotransferase family n=1 Tax=Solimicrobium silvestre TaxID=2099400 RepID=A0A2S9H0P4_9BURK|nr:sulfotransferase domain-containing protein [Solimicrobium silvestre]PRC93549.1 Sulfotransferase family [Solimicrobium silvestre]
MEKLDKKLIVVLGMHRSGTSAITRGLSVLGVDLGDRIMPGVEGINSKGFWEDIDLNALNIEMLNAINSDWNCLEQLEQIDVEFLTKQNYLLRAVALLRDKIGTKSVFGFKDPRVAKLLPFWKIVFDYCSLDVSYVFAVRNPLSVVQSLVKRDGFEREHSYLLWLSYVVTSLLGCIDSKRVLVDYDLLMQMPDQELNRLADYLGLKVDQKKLQNYVSEFLDPKLRHTTYQISDLLLDGSCPSLVSEIYCSLFEVASGKSKFEDNVLIFKIEKWSKELLHSKPQLRLVDKLLKQNRQKTIENHNQTLCISEVKSELVLRTQHVAGLEQTITDQANHVQGVESELSSRTRHVAGLEQTITDQVHHIQGVESELSSRARHIAGLEQTITDQAHHIQGLESELSSRARHIAGLEQTITDQANHVQGVESELSSRTRHVAGLEQTITDQVHHIHGVESELSSRVRHIAGLEQTITDQANHIQGVESELSSRTLHIAGLEQTITDQAHHIQGVESELSLRAQHIAGLEETVTDQANHIQGVESELSSREQQVACLEQTITDQTHHIQGVESELSSRTQHIAGLEKTITDKAKHIHEVESELSSRVKQISNLDLTLKDKNDHILSCDKEHTLLRAHISDLEMTNKSQMTRIQLIEVELERCQNTVFENIAKRISTLFKN